MNDESDEAGARGDARHEPVEATHRVKVTDLAGHEHMLDVAHGTRLRAALLAAGLSPYADLARTFNCGGRGLCATCGVRLVAPDETPPRHWHDRLAEGWGYPRLSCQIVVERSLEVKLVSKRFWGARAPKQSPGQNTRR